MASPSERYLLLGLRLGRHVDGLVDAYYGPDELSRQVDEEEMATPAALASEAESLLHELEDGWLRDQVLGLRTYAGVLAGETVSYADEVEGCYRVRPRRGDTAVYEAAHAQLDALIPGSGSIGERYRSWRRSKLVPPEQVVSAVAAVTAVLRERTRTLVELPAGEGVELDAVHDEPWWAFNYYLGGLRSRVVVNVDLPTTWSDVLELAAHEAYPGHHTERAVKEQRLLRDAGLLEESIQLAPTPSALVGEGIATVSPAIAVDDELLDEVEAALGEPGLADELRHARAVRATRRELKGVLLDAAMMMHEDGATPEETKAYFERWALDSPDEAAHGVRFVADPTWRGYAITYSAGEDLCAAWVDGDPARFARLLTEQVRVGDLLTALSSAP